VGLRWPHPISKMLYSAIEMPVVFIVSGDWDLRGAVRAELRETGIEALGLETVEDMTRVIASGIAPSLVVLDGEILQNSQTRQALENLSSRVPTVVIDSRLNPAPPLPGAATMLRPVQIIEIVERILAILAAGSEST
jgi:hypothetical protein